jgi:hypothetical protein
VAQLTGELALSRTGAFSALEQVPASRANRASRRRAAAAALAVEISTLAESSTVRAAAVLYTVRDCTARRLAVV